MDIRKLKQELLNAIETIVNKKINGLSFDQTYIVPIISKTTVSADTFKYTVRIGEKSCTITTKSNYSVGNRVRVRVPCGNWNNLYIENIHN